MQDSDKSSRPKLLPIIRYRDPEASIEWLCTALGFQKHRVVSSADGEISYAHLSFGGSLIMVTPVRDTAFDDLIKQPDDIDRAQTQSCYFVVRDVRGHHAKAKAAGAEIVLDIKVYEHGGSRYSCRDLEGHIWNFGTYDPWQPLALTYRGHQKVSRFSNVAPRHVALAVGGLMVLAGAAGATWLNGSAHQPGVSVDIATTVAAQPTVTPEPTVAVKPTVTAESTVVAATEQPTALVTTNVQAPMPANPSPPPVAFEQAVIETEKQLHATTASEPTEEPSGWLTTEPIAAATAQPSENVSTLLAEGQMFMTKGDIEAARRIFERAAETGLPEGALAMGSTYDPVSLVEVGLTDAHPEPEQAKRWYRRAHELARTAAQEHNRIKDD